MFIRTDNPLSDFERNEQVKSEWLAKLPKCDICGEPIQEEYYFEFNEDCICERCLIEYFRKENEAYEG